MLKTKENFNFRKWYLFYKLYKTESFMQYMKNFMVLNMPFITKVMFYIECTILKLLGKRK